MMWALFGMFCAGVLALLVLLLCGLMLWAYVSGRRTYVPDSAPDRPGLDCRYHHWIALRCNSISDVLLAMDVGEAVPCNWASAETVINSKTPNRIFISPPIDGWIILFGEIPEWNENSPQEGLWRLLIDFSLSFKEAQYYCFVDAVNAHAWAKAVKGEMVRAYACADGVVTWNDGAITPEEREAGIVVGESGLKGRVSLDGEENEADYLPAHPDYCTYEAAAHEIAARWSLDPESLKARTDLAPSNGTMADVRSWTLSP